MLTSKFQDFRVQFAKELALSWKSLLDKIIYINIKIPSKVIRSLRTHIYIYSFPILF